MEFTKSLLRITPTSYRVYFTLIRATYCLSMILSLSLLKNGFDFFLLAASLTGALMLGGQFYLTIVSEKLLKQKNFLGFLIIMLLNALLIPSLFFPLGIYGVYLFLSADCRERFLSEVSPEWMDGIYEQYDKLVKPV